MPSGELIPLFIIYAQTFSTSPVLVSLHPGALYQIDAILREPWGEAAKWGTQGNLQSVVCQLPCSQPCPALTSAVAEGFDALSLGLLKAAEWMCWLRVALPSVLGAAEISVCLSI